jgi:hypothetical protein
MQYLDDPIIESCAEVIVIPTPMNGLVLPGTLLDDFIVNSHSGFKNYYANDVLPKIRQGVSKIVRNRQGRYNGTYFAFFPTTGLWGIVALRTMATILKTMRTLDIRFISIPKIVSSDLSWDYALYDMMNEETFSLAPQGKEILIHTQDGFIDPLEPMDEELEASMLSLIEG